MTTPRSDTALYIAGPMTGYREFNYPAFHAGAAKLRAAGYTVLNPAENDRPVAEHWQAFMRDALTLMLRATGVATLPDWQYSRGASIEMRLAADLGIKAQPITDWIAQARQQDNDARLDRTGSAIAKAKREAREARQKAER